ncbi:hypothetical protein LTR70_003183 [Exophiala xenobiotica]|uniref:Uncharacterized protein n=1 Tax=Lithohypha guttulata TaxID=1690604 RepID=A0ABR0KGK7_9EURO|nr:hypothetical protein LTR24_002828 [Lithohypha guttulata]KAK5323695.1 hypothetical protein LTR70_003183 [Exophiala xenobiotica]
MDLLIDEVPRDPQGSNEHVSAIEHDRPRSPSQRVSNTSSEIDYAARLRRIPGFEGYTHHSTNSTHQGETVDTRHSAFLKYPLAAFRVLPHSSAAHKASSDQRLSFDANALLATLPQLKTISRKRKSLLQLEVKVENIHRKLAIIREGIANEVKEGLVLSEDRDQSASVLHQRLRHQLRRMDDFVNDAILEENELEPLQRQLTTAQWDVKVAEDDLYASLAGGARPSDSDASLEDRMLTALLLDSDPEPQPEHSTECSERSSLAHPSIFNRKYRRDDGARDSHATLWPDKSVMPRTVASPSSTEMSSPRKEQPAHREVPNVEAIRSQNKVAASAAKREALFESETALFGSCFPEENLLEPIDRGANEPLLLVGRTMIDMRRTDMKAVLGFDPSKVGADFNVTELQKEVTIGVAQRLSRLDVPTIHTRQFISLWGRGMSQNAALESGRTFLYGREYLGQLINQSRIGYLEKMVKNVRKLEVPFSQIEAMKQPDITVAGATPGNNSSVNVEPSDCRRLNLAMFSNWNPWVTI